MPIYRRTYGPGERQFITSSTYRRAAVSLSHAFEGVEKWGCSGGLRPPRLRLRVYRRSESAATDRRSPVEEVLQKTHCLLIGWVLMPEHFHACTTTL